MEDCRMINRIEDIEINKKSKDIPIEPCRAGCEICRQEVTTFINSEFNRLGWLLLFVILYFYGFMFGSPILILILPLCLNLSHSCPYCSEVLFVKKFYPINLKDGYCWFQYGKCVIIVRQIYIIIGLIFIFVFGLYTNIMYMYNKSETAYFNDHSQEIDETVKQYYSSSNLTWEELIKDCGAYVITENSARANEIFKRKYYQKVVEWKGYFLNVVEQGKTELDYNPKHLLDINIRMIPSESIKNPDLFLTVDSKRSTIYSSIINSLETGLPVKFIANIEAIGNEWHSHRLHLLHIEKTDDFIDHNHKLILFQGISFNITGHFKEETETKELQTLTEDNNIIESFDNNTKINISHIDSEEDIANKSNNITLNLDDNQ